MNFSQRNSTLNDNSSQTPDIEPFQYYFVEEPEFSRILRYVIYCVIFVFAICGNITVCVIPFRHRRMRTCTYFLITNLAVSDIGTMLCLPCILVMEWQGEWIMGSVMCKLVNPSLTMFYLVTTNTLVAIAVHRFVVVVFPFRSKVGRTKTALVILLTWLTAFLCVLPSFGARELQAMGVKNNGEMAYRCTEVFPGKTYEEQIYYQNIYTIFQYIINIFLPIVIIVILYIVIAYQLRKMSLALGCGTHSKERRESQTSGVSYQTTRSSRKQSIDDQSLRKRNELERKFLRMLAVVAIVFVLCYVPYTTFFLVVSDNEAALQWKYLKILYHYIYLLMWFPNALNPICYGALDDHYAAIIKSICCRTSKPRTSVRSAASHAGNSIPAYSFRNRSRTNHTMPPIIETSKTHTVSHSSQDEGRTDERRWKTCCI